MFTADMHDKKAAQGRVCSRKNTVRNEQVTRRWFDIVKLERLREKMNSMNPGV